MDFQFFDNPNIVPQPKDRVKIEELNATPYADRFRVFIELKLTPFQERPNLIVVARNQENHIVSELNIIETMHFDMEFTMHLRGIEDPAGHYTLEAELFYENKKPPHDSKSTTFIIPEPSGTQE